ncbi:MAG: hypothetical protein Kow0075_04410 [Salibacteraceae bacterium]
MVDTRTGTINPAARSEVFQQIKARASRGEPIGMRWKSNGPDNIGGRTRAIIELYKKPDTLLAGGVTGGLFVSYNAGATWQPHTQFQNLDTSSSIISAICEDTLNGIIYVGSGSSFDAYGNTADIAWPGCGIFKSTDGGVTFKHLTSTYPSNRFATNETWHAVNRIAVDGNGHVYAATERGLKKSEDFGETWKDVIFIDQGQTIPSAAKFADVWASKSGRVYASTVNSLVYKSETGEAGSFVPVTTGLPTGGRRTVLAVAPQNDDHVYLMVINSASCLDAIYETKNAGESWKKLLVPHNDFNPMQQGTSECTSGQGVYDAALGVSPVNEDLIFIGGVELWRYDGNLLRIASEAGSPPFQDVLPNYVHADKHFVYFSPNNPRRVYVTSDGGISMSTNRGDEWKGLNKGYITTQFYGVSYTTEGEIIIGGTQDNGTLVTMGFNMADPYIGFQVFGNDGIDCDASQLSPILFASSQNGLVVRADITARNNSDFPVGFISGMGSGQPFHTVVKLWENLDDKSSKDSILFEVKPLEISITVSNGAVKQFIATVEPPQPAAIVIPSTISVYSGNQELTLDSDNETLIGDGTGKITFNENGTFNVDVAFNQPPPENSNVYVAFEQRFEANSVLYIESENLRTSTNAYVFEYRLETDLNPGESIKIQDPVQSLLASTGATGNDGGLVIYRNVLNLQETPVPIDISGINGFVSAVEFSSDGDHAFVGTQGGTLYRISGLKDLYTSADLSKITVTQLNGGSMGFGGVTGIAIDPNDDNRLVVTGGGYGTKDRVKFTSNALAPTPFFTNVHGDLPPFPVYDAEIDRKDGNTVLLGTEFGIWGTKDITSGQWTDENEADLTYVPTYDIRQQKLPWDKAKNSGMYFVGTHGRGFWTSTTLLGVDEVDDLPSANAIAGIKVYPNPVRDFANMQIESAFTGKAEIQIFDINGTLVRTKTERLNRGTNQVSLNVTGLRSGNYIVAIDAGGQRSVSRFIILN